MAHNKYALMVLPTFHDTDRTPHELAQGIGTFRGKVIDFVEPGSTDTWRHWLGLHAWDGFMRVERRLVLVSMEAANPDLDDSETACLRNALKVAHTALLLASPYQALTDPRYAPFLLSGELASLDPLRLLSVKSVRRIRRVPRPTYVSSNAFAKAQTVTVGWLEERAQWLKLWQELTPLCMHAYSHAPPLFNLAVAAYVDAVHQEKVEFRLPGFVRAAEGILAVPPSAKTSDGYKVRPKSGKDGYARRSLQICPGIRTHWYVGGQHIRQRLEDLHWQRSACVHGMLPFPGLYAGDVGLLGVAKYAQGIRDAEAGAGRHEYLAEIVAREAIMHVLRNPTKLAEFKDRDTLMDAWHPKDWDPKDPNSPKPRMP